MPEEARETLSWIAGSILPLCHLLCHEMYYYACLQIFYHPTFKCIHLASDCICFILIRPTSWTKTLVCGGRGQSPPNPSPPKTDFAGAVCICPSKGFCRIIVFIISQSLPCILFPSSLTLHRGFTIHFLGQGAECIGGLKTHDWPPTKKGWGENYTNWKTRQSWEPVSSTKLLMP